MLKGRLVAEGPLEQIFAPPYHPYTELLLSVPEMIPTGSTAYLPTGREAWGPAGIRLAGKLTSSFPFSPMQSKRGEP
jgi:hypothetical protein